MSHTVFETVYPFDSLVLNGKKGKVRKHTTTITIEKTQQRKQTTSICRETYLFSIHIDL